MIKIRFLLDKIGFLVGVQKGRFGPRKPNIVIDFPSCSARNWVVFCCFGCVLKKVSGCWFLALLEATAATNSGINIGRKL